MSDWKVDPQIVDDYITREEEIEPSHGYTCKMTYQEYLDNWAGYFGDDDSAEYWYWRYGQKVPYMARKLSEQEFTNHLEELNKAQAEFDVALKANDDDGMGAALARSFPHELALLI